MATGTAQNQFIVPSAQYSVANNSSITFSFSNGDRVFIITSGAAAGSRGLYLTNTSSTAASFSAIASASGLTVSASGQSLTIANASGGYAFILLLVISGGLPS